MSKYKIDPQGLFDYVANLDEKQRAKFVMTLAVRMVNGETFSSKWIVKERRKNKKSLGEYTEEFVSFWKKYPKKYGKIAAFAVWCDLYEENKNLLQECLMALEWQCEFEGWDSKDTKFIPNPETYLKKRRFEDEEPTTTKTNKIAKAY